MVAFGLAGLALLPSAVGVFVARWPLASGLGIGAALTAVSKITLDGVPSGDFGVASALTNAMCPDQRSGWRVGAQRDGAVCHRGERRSRDDALTEGCVAASVVGAGLLALAAVIAAVMTGSRRVRG